MQEKENYTTSILKCNENGGILAHALTNLRTTGLSNLVNTQLKSWNKIAYVGLDDRRREGQFETALMEPLTCFKYRAWSPGHPINHKRHEDCVAITSDDSWKVVHCKKKLALVCEILPMPVPLSDDYYNDYGDKNNDTCQYL